jgi:hypothetical protein
MTTALAYSRPRHTHGVVDRATLRLGLALVHWSRRARATAGHQQLALDAQNARVARELRAERDVHLVSRLG